jgi:hypothetical protein
MVDYRIGRSGFTEVVKRRGLTDSKSTSHAVVVNRDFTPGTDEKSVLFDLVSSHRIT